MNGRIIAALVLIALGVVGLTSGSLSFTRKEKVVDLGGIEITKNDRETLPVGPIAGGVLLVSGIALLAMRTRHA